MNQFFNAYRVPAVFNDGTREKMAFTRQGRSGTSNFKSNFVWTALCDKDTKIKNGDVFRAKPRGCSSELVFLAISVRPSSYSTQATVYSCNGIAQIFRNIEEYDEFDNLKSSEMKHIADVYTNHVTVNATMRLLDAGLLPSTTKEFRLPMCDIQLMDRIVLESNGKVETYCVDAIDTTKFDGLLAVQVSFDNRSEVAE